MVSGYFRTSGTDADQNYSTDHVARGLKVSQNKLQFRRMENVRQDAFSDFPASHGRHCVSISMLR